MKTLLLLISLCALPVISHGATKSPLELIKGPNVLTDKAESLDAKGKKGVVAVFLSAVCPCSNSHIVELTALAKAYPDFAFVGIHSNTDEQRDPTQKYFKESALPFPVIQDSGAKIADELKAYKTPHAYVISPTGEILYRGGVSDSHDFGSSKKKFLREALENLEHGKPVAVSEGRTLGCVISRGEKNVW